MLAMVVNDYAGRLVPRGVLESIASMLAPTGWSGSIRSADQDRGSRSRRIRKYVGAHLVGVHPRFDQRIQRAVDHGR
jgi:hypothetical protein